MRINNDSEKYLEILQGVLLLLSIRGKGQSRLFKLREVLELDEFIFDNLVNDLLETDEDMLKNEIGDISEEILTESEKRINERLSPIEVSKYLKTFRPEKLTDFLLGMKQDSPSKYQNRTTYWIINNLKAEITKSAKELGYSFSENVIFGSTKSFNFNAVALLPKNSKIPIIVFEDEVFKATHILCKIFMLCIKWEENDFDFKPESIINNLYENDVINYFSEFLLHMVLTGSCANTSIFNIPKENLKLLQPLTEMIELFIMGHEMGHIIKGHLYDKSLHFALPNLDAKVITPSWSKEYEADELGLILMLQTIKRNINYPTKYIFMGISIHFTFRMIINEAFNLINGGYSKGMNVNSTHPPSKLRLEHLLTKALELTGKEEAIEFANTSHKTLMIMWSVIEKKFLDDYHNLKNKI